jgi:Uma2 family endonuclease
MSATHPADELQRRPLYRTEYEALGRLGMFDDEKVELLDGEVIYAAEEGPPHAAVCARLARILFEAIPADEGEIRVGNPFALSELSEPEPDFLVAPPQPGNYRTGHPATASLVIEVAQTSRGRDLGVKARLYAAGGAPDYWVVDVAREEVVVHREPAGGTFGSVTRHRDGIIRALHHPSVTVDVRELLR